MKIAASKIVIPKEDHSEIFSMLTDTFSSGVLTNGPLCRRFEEQFMNLVQKKYAICTNSGTSALETAFRIIDVEGKEVIVPTNTNFATPASVLYAGGIVKFADCDIETLSPTLAQIEKLVTDKTAAVVLVHIGGIISSEIEAIVDYCKDKGITLVEDAAHAHGSYFNGKPAGSFGDIACFSFFPTKVMTTGEGGIIVTNDENVYLEAKKYIDQGKSEPWVNLHTRMGNSWRMTELSAALGLTQLNRLTKIVESRRSVAKIYDEKLKELNLTPHPLDENMESNYYKYIVDIDDGINRNKLKQALADQQVYLSGGVYEIPCHLQPVFQGICDEKLEKSEYFCNNHICLPIYPSMSLEEIDYLMDSIRKALKEI